MVQGNQADRNSDGNRDAQATGASGRPVYLFCHIPKCAGSTVKSHMDASAPGRAVRAKRRHGFLRDFGGDYTDVQRSGIRPDEVDFIGGHALSRSVVKAFPDRPIRPCVLIRDPLSFAVSFYNHRNRQAADAGHGAIPVEVYIRSLPKNPMIRVIMTRYLGIGYPTILRYGSADRFRMVDETLAGFWFVGSWMHASELIGRLSQELDLPDQVKIRNAATGDRLYPRDVPEAVARRYLRYNAADQALFERWGDVKWSGRPEPVDVRLPSGDQMSYLANEITRVSMSRAIKIARPWL
ncbi:MAG TPA: hypothetical protein VK862_18560 [Afifellaceae bacterium]|nr:hypothetical protein [Afifellaceae bacterium]